MTEIFFLAEKATKTVINSFLDCQAIQEECKFVN